MIAFPNRFNRKSSKNSSEMSQFNESLKFVSKSVVILRFCEQSGADSNFRHPHFLNSFISERQIFEVFHLGLGDGTFEISQIFPFVRLIRASMCNIVRQYESRRFVRTIIRKVIFAHCSRRICVAFVFSRNLYETHLIISYTRVFYKLR